MRIVQVSPKYHPHIGGVERYVKEISEGLVKRGFEVSVFTTDPTGKLPPEDLINGVRVERFRSFAPSEIGYFSKPLFDALRGTRCDVVHAHGYRALPMFFAALAKGANKARLVVTSHLGFSKLGRLVYLIYNPLFGRLIFSKADMITIVSPVELEEVSLLRKYKDRIVLTPIGIDVSKIETPSNQNRDSSSLNIISAGRIEKKKGIDTIIEVMSRLREMPIRLTIVGEGPYASKIRYAVREMRNVEFRGRVSDEELYRLYSSSHIFVLFSEFESHSVSLTEAMAFGVVPVVSNVGGNAYIVNEETGFLVDYPVEVNEVVKLLKMLGEDGEILEKKSIVARKRILTHFNIEDGLARLIRLYREVLD